MKVDLDSQEITLINYGLKYLKKQLENTAKVFTSINNKRL